MEKCMWQREFSAYVRYATLLMLGINKRLYSK